MTRSRYLIQTFGCQQNVADSERLAGAFESRGMKPAKTVEDAETVVINTCMIRHSAENRVYGMVQNLAHIKERKEKERKPFKIIVTGCMVGMAFRDKTGKYLARLHEKLPAVDEFMPIEEVGFDNSPVRKTAGIGLVPIANGCNNFCTYCVVPYTRGSEISRPFEDILTECRKLKNDGSDSILLLGQNVNSYGSDLVLKPGAIQRLRNIEKAYFAGSMTPADASMESSAVLTDKGKELRPVYVRHLGRLRIPTLFPHLLAAVAEMGFKKVDFISSNPWDFSDELIEVIATHQNISRLLHLPVQSGDNAVLKRMNRWYTAEEYTELVGKIRNKVSGVRFTTDIIVGFCGETDAEFANTVKLCKEVDFEKAYVARYSVRPMTAATKVLKDDVPAHVKKERWEVLEELIYRSKHPGKKP